MDLFIYQKKIKNLIRMNNNFAFEKKMSFLWIRLNEEKSYAIIEKIY